MSLAGVGTLHDQLDIIKMLNEIANQKSFVSLQLGCHSPCQSLPKLQPPVVEADQIEVKKNIAPAVLIRVATIG